LRRSIFVLSRGAVEYALIIDIVRWAMGKWAAAPEPTRTTCTRRVAATAASGQQHAAERRRRGGECWPGEGGGAHAKASFERSQVYVVMMMKSCGSTSLL